MDYDQGEEIRMGIIDLEKAIANVGRELNRIGVNYNQEVKLHNIEKKRKESGDSGELMYQENQIKKSDWAFDKHEVEALFEKYEATAKMIADLISLIQG
jgi:glycyl-tRNA synthetase alpha subunit